MADPSTCRPLTRASVLEAHELIKGLVHHTPTLTNATLDRIASAPTGEGSGKKPANPTMRLYFKCENLQRIGAFKIRGAMHAIERLKMEPGWEEGGGREKGVATHSSGNHAQALALAAQTNGIPAHIIMPSISAPPKIAGTKGYGANVVFSGSTSVEREAVLAEVIEKTGARFVPPYDHPDIVLGQGTLGLELLADAHDIIAAAAGVESSTTPAAERALRAPATTRTLPASKKSNPHLDAVLAPCGGGGMLSGVALSCEGTGVRVFGCEPSFEGADDAKRGYESGKRVERVSSLTVADGLRTPLGEIPWGIIYERRLVGGFYSVSEDEIIGALKLVYERLKLVIEPSAAVPLAVALFNEDFRRMVEREGGEDGWDIGIVFSGGNVSLSALGKLFA
ncbi:tryptophan synthase beta subunit-like PLP-dependent enzyme [Xylaria bambusicola]|uniref:tryptophan synthase beta subunit-like PLP-dependent enzyme n=1 Tax=Xylaria bambusicola TaxID=326684 RepID=UPI00200853EB|nr:tryptophan synthase beta subunit-like PLP-dependent enzyme [Xylaria bambusicola]KAI0528200.1 tryptophan synthase beta subunit-like PLP-dependent enzyme [Xylaria bambusicola]